MPQKTILISINSSWNIVNFRSGLVQALQVEGHRVVALAPRDEWSSRLAVMDVEYHPIEMDKKGVSPRRDFQLLLRYRSALRGIRPDIFLGYTAKPNVYGSLAAHSLGIPVINNVSGLGTAYTRESWLTRILSALYRQALRRSHTVFFQNRDDHDLFIEKRLVRRGQARLVPGSGINLDYYQPQTAPPSSKVSFLIVSRVLRDKGVGEFVEAARLLKAQHPNLAFRLLGPVDAANRTAVSKAEVRQWVAEGILDYLGTANDVRPHIAAADCIVLPSYREGLPRTLLEGAAMAKPIIATDVPGCRDVVRHGVNGFLCDARNARALAEAMRRMAELSSRERDEMGAAGRRLVTEQFDERKVHRLYLRAVEEALKR